MATAHVNEAQVRAIKAPMWTKSWHPVSHGDVIDAAEKAVANAGFEVRSKNYTLAYGGTSVFASWVLNESGVSGTHYMIGFRNSVNKEFALGFTAGTHVMVCSNLMFDGEWIDFRKHTAGMDWDLLKVMAENAVATVAKKTERLVNWQEGLKEVPMALPDFKQATFDAMEAEIIRPSKFASFLTCHSQEMADQDAGEISLSTFHGAVTRLNRNKSLFQVSDVSSDLKVFCDNYIAKAA